MNEKTKSHIMGYITCPTCGLTAPLEDFDPRFKNVPIQNHQRNSNFADTSTKNQKLETKNQQSDFVGCWCPDCLTFIWYNPEDNNQHNILLLEEPAPTNVAESQPSTPYKFNKRLSPLRYPGGKSKLIDYLFTKLQPNKCDTLVEVFAGGASFGLALLDAGIINHLVLNDFDKNLITFWHEVLYNPSPLLEKLRTAQPTHADYAQAKTILSANNPVEPSETAWAYLLANRLSYSGIQKAGCLGGQHGSTDALLARYNPKALIKQITRLASLRDRITLHNQDYADCIQEYYWDDKATLFIDPPYYEKGKALYNHYFTNRDHQSLAFLLQSLTLEFPNCADILITYDNAQPIQDMYWALEPTILPRQYSI